MIELEGEPHRSEPLIVIRRAHIGDAAVLAAYMTSLFAEQLDTISPRPAPSAEDEAEFIRQVETSERAFILLAMNGDEVIGMLDLRAGTNPARQHAGQLGLSVAKDWRGRGIGRRLVERAIRLAGEWSGFCRIELECVPWNTPAIRLYQSMGFVVEGRKRKAVDLRGQPEDDLLMALVW
jgi:putative acetyltransferase